MDDALIINAMATQEDRRNTAPNASLAKIDGRSFEQLLVFGSQLAAEIRFFDLTDRPAGDWQEFFSEHPTALIASILAFDCSAKARKDEEWLASAGQQLVRWRGYLETGLLKDPFADLSEQLLRQIAELASAEMPTREQFRGCIERMQHLSCKSFESSLEWDGHPPQLALYMAFCELFGFAQQTANAIPERLVEFYYGQVLKFGDRVAQVDEVALCFSLAQSEGTKGLTIPSDTLFDTGKDTEGRDVVFANELSIAVTRCIVEDMRSMRIVDAPLGRRLAGASPGASDSPASVDHQQQVPSGLDRPVRSLVVATRKPAGPAEDDPTKQAIPPLFGTAVPGHSEGYTSELAQFGFMVSSKSLLLAGGKRTIKVRLSGVISDKGANATELLTTLAECTGLSAAYLLEHLVRGAFALSLSTAEGWTDCAIARVNVCSAFPVEMELVLVLGTEFPPIAPIAAQDEGPETTPPGANDQPSLRAIMRQQPVTIASRGRPIAVFPFCILEGLCLTAIDLDIEVAQLQPERLVNNSGEIDPTNPFPIFGGDQAAGSFFEIGQSEIFSKPISLLGLEIEWFGLPANSGGFHDYYRYYVIDPSGNGLDPPYDNTVFTCRLSVVQPCIWKLKDPQQPYQLYCAASESIPLEPETTGLPLPDPVKICVPGKVTRTGDLCSATRFEDLHTVPVPQPHYAPQDSAIRLTLTGPQYGYGFPLYAPNVLRSALAELPEGDETREERCAAKCEKEHPTWARPLNDLKRGLALGADKKGADYYRAIVPAIGSAIESLLVSYNTCRTASGTKYYPADIAKIGRQLGAFKREFSEKSRRNQVMLDTLRQWHGTVRASLDGQLSDATDCTRFLEIVLRIDLAFLETLVEKPGAPEDVFPIEIEPVLETLQGWNDTLIKPCCDECLRIKTPAEPYVPQASRVLISYHATAGSPSRDARQSPLEFVHITPFEHGTPTALGEGQPAKLLPEFDYQGALFLGLVDPPLGANQTFLADLGPPALSTWLARLPTPDWAALQQGGWARLPATGIVKDGSQGLQQSGIIEIAIPEKLGMTRLPDDAGAIGWLRASVVSGAGDFPDLRSIHANAGTARRMPDEAGVLVYDDPLPANSITQANADLGDLGEVLQPLPSLGGRPAQAGEEARIGNAERLRHKSRAIDRWDYERLILDTFPSIAAVFVVTAEARHRQSSSDPIVPPGSVLIVVLPRESPGSQGDATRPMVRPETLTLIEAMIKEKASPFARVTVANPPYVRLRLRARIVFVPAIAPGSGSDMLNRELIAFLSPRIGDRQVLSMVDYWQESEITDFVATRPYVRAIQSLVIEEVDHGMDEYPVKFYTSALEHLIETADPASIEDAGL